MDMASTFNRHERESYERRRPWISRPIEKCRWLRVHKEGRLLANFARPCPADTLPVRYRLNNRPTHPTIRYSKRHSAAESQRAYPHQSLSSAVRI
jgi:hypothetical protein